MKLNDAALSGSFKQKIQTKFRSIGFVVTLGAVTYADALVLLKACTAKLGKQTESGLVQIVPELSFYGMLNINAAATQVPIISTATQIFGKLEVSDHGNVECFGNDEYQLEFNTLGAGLTLDIYADDTFISAEGWHNKYNLVQLDAKIQKVVPLRNARFIALPLTTTRLERRYANNIVVTQESKDIIRELYDVNPIVQIKGTAVQAVGYEDYYVLNVADCVDATITASADAQIVIIENVNIQ